MTQTRKRGQRGFVREESGNWRGYYNIKVVDPVTRKTKHKQQSVLLGPVERPRSESELKAYDALRAEIQRVTGGGLSARPDSSITLQKFTETRWLPLREAKLRPSSKASTMHTLSHIFARFGSVPLDRLDKVELQTWLNKLAEKHSKSLVLHAKFYLKSILAEAQDQAYLLRSPANKLESPRTKQVANDVLTPEQFRAVIAELKLPYNLMVRVAVACAFRPSELLALRWRDLDVAERLFRIRETVYRGELRPYTKTTEPDERDSALLTVPVPDDLVQALVDYRGPNQREVYELLQQRPKRENFRTKAEYRRALEDLHKKLTAMGVYEEHTPHGQDEDFIFSTKEGTIMNKENVLFRVFRPVQEKLKLPALNFQTLRRTAATLAQSAGSVKDVQGLLRHKTADTTASVYMQHVPESARRMINEVYEELTKAHAVEGV
jgi:integrase